MARLAKPHVILVVATHLQCKTLPTVWATVALSATVKHSSVVFQTGEIVVVSRVQELIPHVQHLLNVPSTAHAQQEHEVGPVLDLIVTQEPVILEVFHAENEPLTVDRNAFSLLDFVLERQDALVARERDGERFSCDSLDKEQTVRGQS